MKVGVPRETAPGERRVAIVPEVVRRLGGKGVEVVVEPGAGAGALIPDRLFEEAGATLGDPWDADVVVTIGAQTGATPCPLGRGQALARGPRTGAHRLPRPPPQPRHDARARGGRRDGLRHGGDPAHLACP